MTILTGRKKRIGAVAAVAAVTTGLAFTFTAPAAAAPDPADPSAAQGQVLQVPAALLGGINVADLGHTLTSFPSEPGPVTGTIDASVLGSLLSLDVGTVSLPLITDGSAPGLLNLGTLGAASSYASSPSTIESIASSGAINSDGTINPDVVTDPGFSPASLNLNALLRQLLGDAIADTVLDTATIDLGALASHVTETAGTVDSAYMVSDLGLNLHSPLVGNLTTVLTDAVNDIVAPVSGLVDDGGLVDDVIGDLSTVIDAVDLTLLGTGVRLSSDAAASGASITGLDTFVTGAVDDLVTQELSNTNGSVVVDLATGTVSVDLAELVIGANGLDPADLENLNDLPANTEVLDSDVVLAITQGITEALIGEVTNENSLTGKLHSILNNRLWNDVGININVNAAGELCVPIFGCDPIAEGAVVVNGTLAEFAGYNGASLDSGNISTTLDLLGEISVGDLINGIAANLLAPIVNNVTGPLLTTITNSVLGGVQSALQDELLTPVVGTLLGAVEPVLEDIVSIRINEQPTEAPLSADTGDLPGGSFTVRAMSITVIDGVVDEAVKIDLASSTVKALNELAPEIDALDPVAAGSNLPVTGEGWLPGTVVTLQLEDASGDPIGTPVTKMVEPDGSFPAGTYYSVPANTPEGTGYMLIATDTDDNTAQDTVEITAAAIDDVNTNASASASASANADDDSNAAAQVAAQAAALADASSTASAAADASAEAAAEAAATTTASTVASATADATATASAAAAAQTAAMADNSANTNANTAADAAADPASAAQAAAIANSSTDASVTAAANASATASATAAADAEVDTNASASAAASANADADSNAAAQAAAEAAALADATTAATAAADADAATAAQAAATVTASSNASTDASSAANANAAAAAQAAALADASSTTNADTSASANANASSASESAAIANSSADASVSAAADADASASPAATATTAATATATTAASATATADADASPAASADAAASGGTELPGTGGDIPVGLLIGGGLLLLIGAGVVAYAAMRRRAGASVD